MILFRSQAPRPSIYLAPAGSTAAHGSSSLGEGVPLHLLRPPVFCESTCFAINSSDSISESIKKHYIDRFPGRANADKGLSGSYERRRNSSNQSVNNVSRWARLTVVQSTGTDNNAFPFRGLMIFEKVLTAVFSRSVVARQLVSERCSLV